ncbi:MAG TPA: hypothetical protein VIX86_21920 [Streptosporangiaceae bacterium]
MTSAPPGWLAEVGTEPEAVIREARRRQRRRWLATGAAMALVAAATGAVIAGSGAGSRPRPPGRHTGSAAPAHAVRPALPPGLVLAGAATTLVMWPVGYPLFTPTSGPPAYVDDLGSGRLQQRQIPGIIGCDCRPYLIGAGGRLVYVGSGGTTAISADLKGRPRVLGATYFFAPSAAPGQVWLVHYRGGVPGQAPVTVRPVPVTGGPAGAAVTLPAATDLVMRGTDAGFLLELRHRLDSGLALWSPGSMPRTLPHAPTAGIDSGFDATSRLVAYGTGCRWDETARNAPQDANTSYLACAMLRALDVVTGRLVSFPAPPGTAGWVPDGFDYVSAISRGNQMIAAYAATRPQGEGRVRLYVMRLTGPSNSPMAVPSSGAILPASTAWTAKGSWLLYQGPGGHLWAYQATSGTVRASSMRHYGMVAVPSDPG